MKDINLNSEEMMSKLRSVDELKVIGITGFKIIVSPQTDEVGLVFVANNNEYVIPLNHLESITASYYINGFAKQAHIPDIYATYMHLAKSLGFVLTHAILESKHGDVVYGRLVWKDTEGKLFTQIVTPGDVFVFANTHGITPGVVTALLEDMCTIDEWPYHYDVDEW